MRKVICKAWKMLPSILLNSQLDIFQLKLAKSGTFVYYITELHKHEYKNNLASFSESDTQSIVTAPTLCYQSTEPEDL